MDKKQTENGVLAYIDTVINIGHEANTWPNSIAIVDKITGQVWLWVEHLAQWIILQPK